MTMNDHCEPFYQTHSFPEKDAYNAIKMEICSDPPTGIRRKVRAIVPDIDDIESEIIRNNVKTEAEGAGLGSMRGYYTFVHRPLCKKCLDDILVMCFKYHRAFIKFIKYRHIYLHWWWKPGGPGARRLAATTLVGRLPPPPLLPVLST